MKRFILFAVALFSMTACASMDQSAKNFYASGNQAIFQNPPKTTFVLNKSTESDVVKEWGPADSKDIVDGSDVWAYSGSTGKKDGLFYKKLEVRYVLTFKNNVLIRIDKHSNS